MKLISAAIALLASATLVSSLPVYESYSTTTDWPATEDWSSTTDWPTTTSTYNADGSAPTPSEAECDGFKITSQTEADITWVESSKQEVLFDFGSSKVKEVEYVDLMKYGTNSVVDEWATGPWSSSNPRTGLHEIHIHRGESGYYQFLVYAATENHHHCTYLSGKFKITSLDGGSHANGGYNESSSTYPDEPYSTSDHNAYGHYDESSTTYYEPSSTYSDEPYSTSSADYNAHGHYDEPSTTSSDDEPYPTSDDDYYAYGRYDQSTSSDEPSETYSDEPSETYSDDSYPTSGYNDHGHYEETTSSDEPSPTYSESSNTYDYPESTSTSDEYPYES